MSAPLCRSCDHPLTDHADEAIQGGVYLVCQLPHCDYCCGFAEKPAPSPVVHHMTDEEYADGFDVWREHQEMRR